MCVSGAGGGVGVVKGGGGWLIHYSTSSSSFWKLAEEPGSEAGGSVGVRARKMRL